MQSLLRTRPDKIWAERKRKGRKKTTTRYDYNLPIIKPPTPVLNAHGTSWSVLLNVSYHKVYHYTWFMGGDLTRFPDSISLIV